MIGSLIWSGDLSMIPQISILLRNLTTGFKLTQGGRVDSQRDRVESGHTYILVALLYDGLTSVELFVIVSQSWSFFIFHGEELGSPSKVPFTLCLHSNYFRVRIDQD